MFGYLTDWNTELKSIIISVILSIYLKLSHKFIFTSVIFSTSLKKKKLRAVLMIPHCILMVIILLLFLKIQKQRETFLTGSWWNILKPILIWSQLLLNSKVEASVTMEDTTIKNSS